jgi:hypothetical protein
MHSSLVDALKRHFQAKFLLAQGQLEIQNRKVLISKRREIVVL